jgi:hypothetical protein
MSLILMRMQSGDETSLKVWTMLCDASRKEFQQIYDMLDIKCVSYLVSCTCVRYALAKLEDRRVRGCVHRQKQAA